MRAGVVVAAVWLAAVIVGGDLEVAQGRPTTVVGCAQLGNLKTLFPAARAAGFAERQAIKVQEARQPVWPGRCGAFWTTYKSRGKTVDVSVTLYKTPKDVDAALAEPQAGRVHVRPNGARDRSAGPSPGSVSGTPSSSIFAVSAFRNLFISSTSISTSFDEPPVRVSAQLRLHRLIEDAFARLQQKH
jgi:hypothetical protein